MKMHDDFNRLLSIDNAPAGDNTTTSFAYDYNIANQRTAMIDQRGFTWDYQYDSLGQLTESRISFPGDNVSLLYRYYFDTIGNRKQEKIGFENPENFAVWDYSSNSVNQYQSKTHDNVTDNFTYDADGNLTQNKDWNYTWDAENRPIKVESREIRNDKSIRKLSFVYDDQGRRISKKVEDLNGDNTTYTTSLYRRFIYDRWNLLAELDENANPVRTYVWGNDLSGSLQGAGGIGGLLMVKHWNSDDNITCFPAYDGSGNVRRMVRSDNGTTHTYFGYDAFGKTFTHGDDPATPNPFGYSTKYYDNETQMYYYGYRYTKNGRWISRDPSGERGGKPLYVFAANNPINRVDFLGLWPWTGCCNGKTYNTFTQCCCKGNIVSRKPIPTGIKECSLAWNDHSYIMIDGWSGGFYPGGGTFPWNLWGQGEVQIPDQARGQGSCTDTELSPCSVDFDKLKDAIKKSAERDKQNPPYYILPLFTCKQWVSVTINNNMINVGGCTIK